jgi:hypothetical protein
MSQDLSDLYPQSLSSLGLNAELLSILNGAGLQTIEDLVELLYQGPAALMALPGLRPSLLEELIETLRSKGIIQ